MADSESSGSATKLTRADAAENARRLFGVSPHVVAGALHGDERDEFTEGQIKSAVDKFAKREVGA